jgi:hypothetical protein
MATWAMSWISEESRLDFLQGRGFISSPKNPDRLCGPLAHFEARLENCEKRLLASCLSVCPSVRLCVCPHGTSQLPRDGFSWTVSSCKLYCAVMHPLLTFLTTSVKLHSLLRSHTSVTDIVSDQCRAAYRAAQSYLRY